MINLHRGTLLLVTFQTRIKKTVGSTFFKQYVAYHKIFFSCSNRSFGSVFVFVCLFVCLFFSISALTDIFFHSINNRATEAFPDNFNLRRVDSPLICSCRNGSL